jgi:hypothetical protein
MFKAIISTACAVGAAVILSACSTVAVKSTFDPGAAAFIQTKGTATITGQAFLRRNDGIVVYGAGSTVQLIPKTAYSDARIAAMFKGGSVAPADMLMGTEVTVKDEDPRFAQYTRTTVANGEGRFTFTDVPDGNYYITAPVIWMVEYAQGGTLLEPVSVVGGQSVDVVMNGQ